MSTTEFGSRFQEDIRKWEEATERRKVTLLPDPEPRERKHLIVSVDDHLVEPPDLFEGRIPARYAEGAPRIVEDDIGRQVWEFEGRRYPNVGFNAVAGRPPEEHTAEPLRFDEMRRGCWDIAARLHDMDINGVWASLCFPSFLPGFAGQKFSLASDPELGLATLRAYNDWHLEGWAGYDPRRIIPCQLPWLRDPEVGAAMVRENAERGFHAMTFPENPAPLGFPSLHSGHWDPLMRACEETGTAVCIHVGSSSRTHRSSDDAPPDTIAALFSVNSQLALIDWLYSKIPVRFPGIRIVVSEGGIGWVAGQLDRLDHNAKHHAHYDTWRDVDLSPTEVVLRNFWFCTIDDPTAFRVVDRIGVENVLIESDYPHADSTWPDTQIVLGEQLHGLPDTWVDKITHQNAAELFDQPLDGAAEWLQSGRS